MIRELFLKLLSPIVIIVLLFLLEEIICFIIIKKRGKYNEYKEYKSKKAFCTYSLYLYHEKKYLIIKLVIIIAAILLRYVDDKGNVSSVNENDLYNTDVWGVLYTLNGEVYFDNTNVYWDSSKLMHYFDSNQDVVVANYSFIVNTETGECTINAQ